MNTRTSSLLVLMGALVSLSVPALAMADIGPRGRHANSAAHKHVADRHAHPRKHKVKHANHWRAQKRHVKPHYYAVRPHIVHSPRPVVRARYAAHGVFGYHEHCSHGYQAGVNLWLDGFSFSYTGYGRH